MLRWPKPCTGKCQYEQGSDGKMIHFLTNPEIVTYQNLSKEWNVKNVLDTIAHADPPFHALIDTGLQS
jgi:hypothetical protein